jgi:hypothetical protein
MRSRVSWRGHIRRVIEPSVLDRVFVDLADDENFLVDRAARKRVAGLAVLRALDAVLGD